jgi:hypothetical protein
VGEDESAHLGLVAGTCSRYQANSEWKLVFSPPNNCSVFISDTCGVRGSISMLILCVLTPSLALVALQCKTAGRRAEARKEG